MAEKETKVETEQKPKDEVKVQAKQFEGLIKMHRNGEIIHAHPSIIQHHEKNGWKAV